MAWEFTAAQIAACPSALDEDAEVREIVLLGPETKVPCPVIIGMDDSDLVVLPDGSFFIQHVPVGRIGLGDQSSETAQESGALTQLAP